MWELNEIFPFPFPNHDRVVITLLGADEVAFGDIVDVEQVMSKEVLFATVGEVRVLLESYVFGFEVGGKILDRVQFAKQDRQVVGVKQVDRVPAVEVDHEWSGAPDILVCVGDGETSVNVLSREFFAGFLSTVGYDNLVKSGVSQLDVDWERNGQSGIEKHGPPHL